MRISDWSSDVCSSDLQASKRNAAVAAPQQSLYLLRPIWHRVVRLVSLGNMHLPPTSTEAKHRPELGSAIGCPSHKSALERPDNVPRSEEHTAELQSLMRISYAVFCLNKKIITPTKNANKQYNYNAS